MARLGAAGGGSLWSRRGRRTDTSSQEAGGPRVRPGGGVRRRLEGAGAAEWTAPPLPAWGLLSTSGPWSGDREVGAAGGGRRQEGAPWRPVAAPGGGGGPRRTMHLGVKPRLRVFGPQPRPLCVPATVEDRTTKAEPCGPGYPRGPSPAGLFRIRGRRRRVGEGWC